MMIDLDEKFTKGWKVVEFDYDLLRTVIKEQEWYNIPNCIKLAIKVLINCAELQKKDSVAAERREQVKLGQVESVIDKHKQDAENKHAENQTSFG
jgi:hypothetical protein